MKRNALKSLIWLLLTTLSLSSSFAQAPSKFSFQSVVRNSTGALVTSTTVGMRISILNGSSTGTVVYVETQTPTTNANGLATIMIGAGTVVSGIFDSVAWGSGTYFLKIETDPTGGTSYSITATQQLVSVPYALYDNNANYAAHSGDTSVTGIRPTVITDSANSVSYYSVKLFGHVTTDGGEFLIYKGFCVDTTLMPSTSGGFLITGSMIGSYNLIASGLNPNTHYHARAFATNAHGTAYGDTISFTTRATTVPTVITDSISSITSSAAVGYGDVTDNGGSAVTARGICYGNSPMPTISSHLAPSGSDTGYFSTTLSSLTSSLTYYARAYATNSTGTGYGAQDSFVTVLVSVPTITTDSPTSVTYTSAVTGISVSSAGGSTITWQGVCYSTSPYPTTSSSVYSTATGVGHFIADLTGLTAGTTYYVRAFSVNASGTVYGSQYSFSTPSLAIPTVSTNTVIGISATTATSGGDISSDGGSYVSVRGVCYSKYGTPTVDSSITSDGSGTGIYNSNMTGLTASTTYYVRAYATNSVGTGYGSVISFTTDSIVTTSTSLPVVGTDVPYTTSSAYASGGYVSFGGGSSVTARGICWGTSTPPSLSGGSYTTDGSGLGYFTSTISSLSGCGTTYYVRAYATNSTGTGYGNIYSFSTGLLPTITSDSISSVSTSSLTYTADVTVDGGCTVTYRGVCWAIHSSPTISDYTDTVGSGTGTFTATITTLAPSITYHLRSYATNSIGTVYGTEQVITMGIPSGLYVGESYAGGIIFYLDSTHLHGMVCAPTDQSSADWGCPSVSVSGTSDAFGTGQTNTADIVAACSDLYSAAYECDTLTLGGYSDWFLPSLDELQMMNTNLNIIGLGSFTTYYYWSSTQTYYSWCPSCYSSDADLYYFSSTSGFYTDAYKSNWYYVRAVRRF